MLKPEQSQFSNEIHITIKQSAREQGVMEAPGGCDVFLHVYDLIEQNNWTHWAGLGVYHSGIEVYGVEYAFGGHEFNAPGVFATHPRCAPGTVAWREAIHLGRTSLTPAEVYELVQSMGMEYKGNRYHLLQMNCNTFSSDLSIRLTGNRPPAYVNRLADIAVTLHCLLPQGWVPPLRPPTALAPCERLDILPSPHESGRDEERTALLGGKAVLSSSGSVAQKVPVKNKKMPR